MKSLLKSSRDLEMQYFPTIECFLFLAQVVLILSENCVFYFGIC